DHRSDRLRDHPHLQPGHREKATRLGRSRGLISDSESAKPPRDRGLFFLPELRAHAQLFYYRPSQERHHDLVVAGDLVALAAFEGRPLDDVHARPVMTLHIEV